ncbi:MAG: hypothetical protein ACJ8EY_06525 [Sphingomicrobium sp.]
MSIPLIAGIAVLVIIIAIALTQRSGPRVTHIDRVVEQDKDEGR